MSASGTTVRCSYKLAACRPMLGSAVSAQEAEAAVLQIVARWNERMPRNKCRILDNSRFQIVRACLETLTADDVCSAIDCYAGQTWNRTHQAWKAFDNWFVADNVRTWYERACEDAERREQIEQAKRSAPQNVQALYKKVAGLAKKSEEHQAIDAERAAFDSLPEERKRELLEQAGAELFHLGGSIVQRNAFTCRQRAIVIMKRESNGAA